MEYENNVICIKTKQLITTKRDRKPEFYELSGELQDLIERFEIGDVGYLVQEVMHIQNPKNGPYVGDCTHGIHTKRYAVLPFPIPNYKCETYEVLGAGILDGSEPDPLMHMDKKYRATYRILKHAKMIYTRSDLVAHDEYIEELNKDVKIIVVYKSADDTINRDVEPGCPSYKRRVKAVEKLVKLGFNAKLVHESALLNIKLAE